MSAASAGVATPPAAKLTTGSRPSILVLRTSSTLARISCGNTRHMERQQAGTGKRQDEQEVEHHKTAQKVHAWLEMLYAQVC